MNALKSTIAIACLLALSAGAGMAQKSVQFSGQLRIRAEGRTNADFNSERLDNTAFVLNRLRIGLSKKLDRHLRLFVQIQDSRLWGEAGSSLNALGVLDLHQGYLEIKKIGNWPLHVRLGRQKIALGSERLVGNYEWHNVSRSFDAAMLRLKPGKLDFRLWLAQMRDENAPTVARNQEFGGVFFTAKKWFPGRLELYSLLFYDGRSYEGSGELDEHEEHDEGGKGLTLWTFGSRLVLKPLHGLAVEIEGAYQTGNRGPLGISAYGLAGEIRYRFDSAWQPALFAGAVYGSGDENPEDDRVRTFSNLFPSVHRFLGSMDYTGWSNIAAWSVGAGLEPARRLRFKLSYFAFALATDRDHWYRAGGYNTGAPSEIYRTAVPGAGTDLAQELDVNATWRLGKHLQLEGGLSAFLVGQFIKNTGGNRADNSYWGYFAVQAEF